MRDLEPDTSSTPSRPGANRSAAGAGFTLVELLVVVAVVGIISAIALPALQTAVDKTKQRATMADMRTISQAIETYHVDRGRLPAQTANFADLEVYLVPYSTSVLPLNDRWANPFHYYSDGLTSYSIISFGKDGADGPDISPATKFEFERDIVMADGAFVASVE